jgi:hypothetical protein
MADLGARGTQRWAYVAEQFSQYEDTHWLTHAGWPALAYPVTVLCVSSGECADDLVQGGSISVI